MFFGFFSTMSQLPDPDPRVGEVANEEISQARRDAESALQNGDMDLNALFSQESEETGEGHRVFGHMHIRAALLALPGIGDVKANKILDDLEIEHDTHIAALGVDQRQLILRAVQDNS